MKKYMYSVLDVVSGIFAAPFVQHGVKQAIRSFEDAAQRADTAIGAHPEDHHLYEVGEFDDLTGVVTGKLPELVHKGSRKE